MHKTDPIGNAIWDYHQNKQPEDIIVECDIMLDDYIPTSYLFRQFEDFPELEKIAMEHCKGKILDVGAAAGPHSKYLFNKGFDVTTIDISPGAHAYLKEILPDSSHFHEDINNFNKEKYDTILLLMNGIGIAETFNNIVPFLKHLASLLNDKGKILCESTDVIDIFHDDDGGLWVDLNAHYYGEFTFNMKYKTSESGWFKWIYLDRQNFETLAKKAGLKTRIIFNEEESFLIEITK